MSWFPAAYDVLLACVALQRIAELVLTHRRLAALPAHERARAADGKWAWRAMVMLHTALIIVPACEVHLLARRPPLWLFTGSLVVFAAAQLLRYWAIASAGPAWNARAVVAPSMKVSARGPYRFIRHPNYVAVLVEFSAVPLAGGAWIAWIVLNALHAPVIAARIRAEEKLLATLPEWNTAMSSKGRFLPRATRP
jgi:methyltransferase